MNPITFESQIILSTAAAAGLHFCVIQHIRVLSPWNAKIISLLAAENTFCAFHSTANSMCLVIFFNFKENADTVYRTEILETTSHLDV